MAELSGSSGVPIPTIKFYIREGLLSGGERTSPNQAQYDEGHVRRLKLIRALVDLGGLSIAATRAVLEKLDSGEPESLESLGKVQYALMPRRSERDESALRSAEERVDELLARQGWRVRPSNPARSALVDVVAVLDRLGQHDVLDHLSNYADAAHTLAEVELDRVNARELLEARAEGVVVVAVLGDALFGALRRLAHEDFVIQRMDAGGAGAAR
jgi:DNA-binding transcriptional MerR regulator